jgi:D-alanyl-D-alanine carboxypeptidase
MIAPLRRLVGLAALVMVLGYALAAGPAGAAKPLDPALRSQIEGFAKARIGDGITGVVVGIKDPKHGDLMQAYGDADTAGTAMSTRMHYRIASVTKTFTATAILQLVDQGKVGLDQPIGDFVPRIPNGGKVTIRDLLAMRSGLYDYSSDPAIYGAFLKNPLLPGYSLAKPLAVLRAHAGECTPPDRKTQYDNTNYLLLGLVLEKVTGTPVPVYLDRLARRMGLTHTSFPTGPRLPAPFSHGYSIAAAGKPARDVTESNPLFPWTSGAMISTVPDMLRYAPELGTGKGLEASTWRARRAFTPLGTKGIRVRYGLGLTEVGDWLGHDGSILGYSDFVGYLPSAKASVVVMVNAAEGDEVPVLKLWGEIVTLLYPKSLPTF